jgi:hypothetical protein
MLRSREIAELTGLPPHLLADLCRDLDVGRTTQGAKRRFNNLEAATMVLVCRLARQGVVRREALAVAEGAAPVIECLIRNPEDERRWLFAHRKGSGWKLDFESTSGSPEALGDESVDGYVLINVRSIVRDVLAAGRQTVRR